MKTRDRKPTAAADGKETFTLLSRELLSRREFLAVSAAAGVSMLLPRGLSAAVDGKKTFTLLHTNDMHSAFIGMGPEADYTPFKLNDDNTRGGFARLSELIAKRKDTRKVGVLGKEAMIAATVRSTSAARTSACTASPVPCISA